jgi:hypothetical protein
LVHYPTPELRPEVLRELDYPDPEVLRSDVATLPPIFPADMLSRLRTQKGEPRVELLLIHGARGGEHDG